MSVKHVRVLLVTQEDHLEGMLAPFEVPKILQGGAVSTPRFRPTIRRFQCTPDAPCTPSPAEGTRGASQPCCLLLTSALALSSAGAVEAGGVAAPRPSRPPSGAANAELPPFVWRASKGADSYEFQIAADRGFNSSIRGLRNTRLDTSNTRATITTAVPNGTYWWRVRAVTKSGQVSGWSKARSVRKAWTAAPKLRGPVNGARVSFPSQPLTLSWAPVQRAAKYLVSLGTDPDLATLIGDKTVETSGTSYAPSLTPSGGKDKTFYWAVTPLDAQGNRGAQSRIASFVWEWPSATATKLRRTSGPSPRDVRPGVLVAAGRRSRTLRARGELLARLRAGLEGLL